MEGTSFCAQIIWQTFCNGFSNHLVSLCPIASPSYLTSSIVPLSIHQITHLSIICSVQGSFLDPEIICSLSMLTNVVWKLLKRKKMRKVTTKRFKKRSTSQLMRSETLITRGDHSNRPDGHIWTETEAVYCRQIMEMKKGQLVKRVQRDKDISGQPNTLSVKCRYSN